MPEPVTPAPPGPLETLVVERAAEDERVLTVTFNRPERKNAVSGAMYQELLATFRWIAPESSVRVVVLTGAGGEFCSGADLAGGADGHPLASMRVVTDVVLALHRLPQPTIARVDGVAAGLGLNLALGCDLVVASDRSRFSEIFARRGMSIDGGGSWLLPRRIGLHKAKELTLFGDIIDAAEADRLGLVNKIVPVDDLDQTVGEWAARLAGGPPIALAQSKALLDNAFAVSFDQALDDEGRAQTVNLATADTAEAVAAFLEKRTPRFEGR